MTHVVSAERIDPSKLGEVERAALTKTLYQVQPQIFAGPDEQAFARYVVDSPAEATRILLYRNRRRQLVGYFAVHRFVISLDERSIVVFRAETGLLPRYRQADCDLSFLLQQVMAFTTDPNIRFHVDTNPTFGKGTGLLTLVPVTVGHTFQSVLPFGIYTLGKRLRARRTRPAANVSSADAPR